MFLLLSDMKKRLKNITSYLLLEILAWNVSFIRSKLFCCASLYKLLPDKGGACTAEARGSRSGARLANAVVCKACPAFGSRRALWILSMIFFVKSLSTYVFLIPFTWRLSETMKRWFMHEVQRSVSHSQAVPAHSMKCSTLNQPLFVLTVLVEDFPAPLCSVLIRCIVN